MRQVVILSAIPLLVACGGGGAAVQKAQSTVESLATSVPAQVQKVDPTLEAAGTSLAATIAAGAQAVPTATTRPAATSTTRPAATPTTRPAATASPSPSPAIAGQSRQSPVPAGEWVKGAKGLEAKVLEYEPDAWPQIQEENSFNDPPQEGFRFAIAKVQVRNVSGGSEEINVDWGDFKAVGSSNKIFTTFEDSCGVIPDPLDEKLFEGGETTGNVCWQVPTEEENILILWEPLLSFDRQARRYMALPE